MYLEKRGEILKINFDVNDTKCILYSQIHKMTTIYKYPIPVQEKYIIELPRYAQIIRVEDVDGLFFLWAIVNTDEGIEAEKRFLEFYKTGQEIKTDLSNLSFLGTCKLFIMQELCLYVFENVYESQKHRIK